MDQDDPRSPTGDRRLTALCAVALVVLSVGLLKGLAQEARGAPPVQSLVLLFGPAPAVADPIHVQE